MAFAVKIRWGSGRCRPTHAGSCLVCGGRWSSGSGFSQSLAALLVEHFEVDLGQVHRRETGTGDHVGDVAAQVRVNDVRATDSQQWIHLISRNVAGFENTGLLAFNQERDLVFDLGGHGDGDGRLVDAVGDGFSANVE